MHVLIIAKIPIWDVRYLAALMAFSDSYQIFHNRDEANKYLVQLKPGDFIVRYLTPNFIMLIKIIISFYHYLVIFLRVQAHVLFILHIFVTIYFILWIWPKSLLPNFVREYPSFHYLSSITVFCRLKQHGSNYDFTLSVR